MRTIIFFCVGLWLLSVPSSCIKSRIKPPEILLGDSMLVNILTDGFILNAAFIQTAGTIKDSIGKVYSQQIFDKYQVPQNIIDENVRWLYAENRIDSIFNMMIDRMDYLERKISQGTEDPPR